MFKETPFLLLNVDVLSTIDFGEMLKRHKDAGALATLGVQERENPRYLLFDEELRNSAADASLRDNRDEMVRRAGKVTALAFTGVHIISPRMIEMMREDGVFSIIDVYLRLASLGEKIQNFRADNYYWRDLGKLDQVQQAELDFQRKVFS